MRQGTLVRRLRHPRSLSLLDQLLFAGWSFLLLVWAGQSLSGDDLGTFSVVYLVTITAVQLARPFVAEPIVLVRSNRSDRQVLAGGLRVVGIATAATFVVAIAGLVTSRWLLLCPAVVACSVLQDSLRSYCAAEARVHLAVFSDGALFAAMGVAIVAAAHSGETGPLALLAWWLGMLVVSCIPPALLLARGGPDWSLSVWWRSSSGFAKGATLGGTIDLLVVNACFALPALLGHRETTAALTAGRTLFAVPLTLVGAWTNAWIWQHRDTDHVPRPAARRLALGAIALTAGWGLIIAAIGRSGLSRAFGTAGAPVRAMLVPLITFNVLVAISVACKAVLRAVRAPGRAQRSSWLGDICLLGATLICIRSTPGWLTAGLALALVPLVVGYLSAMWTVTSPVAPPSVPDALATSGPR